MSVILVKVHNGYFFKGQKQLVANSDKTTFIDATSGASYELVSQKLGHAPERILIEKRANNLLVAFEDKTQIDLVIRDFFKYEDSQLVGKDSYGQYYSYLPVFDEYEALFGKEIWVDNYDSNQAYLVELGSYAKVTPWLLEADSQPLGNLLKPALLSLGTGALLLYGVENWRIDNKESSKSSKSFTPPTPKTYDKNAIVDIDSTDNQVTDAVNLGSGVGVTIKTTDAAGNPSKNITYELTNSANGLFDINKFTGKVVVAKSLENQLGEKSITVKATDSTGKTKEIDVKITVKDADATKSAPVVTKITSNKKHQATMDEPSLSDVLQDDVGLFLANKPKLFDGTASASSGAFLVSQAEDSLIHLLSNESNVII